MGGPGGREGEDWGMGMAKLRMDTRMKLSENANVVKSFKMF